MTDQSHNFTQAEHLDPIITLMGRMPPEELDLRRKLAVAGRLAARLPHETESRRARTFCWEVCDLVHEWQYAPASIERLEKIVQHVRRIMICANDAMLLADGI